MEFAIAKLETMKNMSPEQQEIAMKTAQLKANDVVFLETGVEEDVLTFSITKNNLHQDPEFQNVMNENMAKLQMARMKTGNFM